MCCFDRASNAERCPDHILAEINARFSRGLGCPRVGRHSQRSWNHQREGPSRILSKQEHAVQTRCEDVAATAMPKRQDLRKLVQRQEHALQTRCKDVSATGMPKRGRLNKNERKKAKAIVGYTLATYSYRDLRL